MSSGSTTITASATTTIATACTRSNLEIQLQCDRFRIHDVGGAPLYDSQYSTVYARRLRDLRSVLFSQNPKLASYSYMERILELKEQERSLVVGTVVVVKGSSVNIGDTFVHNTSSSSNDKNEFQVILEDDSGRVTLNFDGMKCEKDVKLVTGVVCAVVGVVQPNTGVMDVEQVFFANHTITDTSDDTADHTREEVEEGPYILFVSGLQCGSSNSNDLSLKRELLVDYITGQVAAAATATNTAAAQIARVIIAGGSCAAYDQTIESFSSVVSTNVSDASNNIKNSKAGDSWKAKKAKLIENRKQKLLYPVQELDAKFLAPLLAGGVPIDLLPGAHDPTNANMPQQPLHPSLLPSASCYCYHNDSGSNDNSSLLFQRCSNPYESKIVVDVGEKDKENVVEAETVTVIGSDGTSIRDFIPEVRTIQAVHDYENKNKDEDIDEPTALISEMEALELSFQYGHMAPMSPDSMPCFPLLSYTHHDPFVLQSPSNGKSSEKIKCNSSMMYFMGNCTKFECKRVSCDTKSPNVQLLCIPSFAETSQVVLWNIKTKRCNVLQIDVML